MIFLLFLIFPHYSTPQTIEYVAASPNPPHGCPNYGLCTDVTTTLVSSTNVSTTYKYGCAPENCYCVDGTTNGTEPCDTIVDQCGNDPCGTPDKFNCTSKIESYDCTCQAGFTGEKCDSEIGSACATSQCREGSTCEASDNSTTGYTCRCTDKQYGTYCENDNLCADWPCQNGGTCSMVLSNSNWICNCTEGWQGRRCETKNSVLSSPVMGKCYKYDYVKIGTHQTKYKDDKMTSDKCNEYAQEKSTDDKTLKYLTLCGEWCMVSEDMLVKDDVSMKDDCKKSCGGDSSEYCGKVNSRCIVYEAGEMETDPNACEDNSTLCGAELGHGMCINWQSDVTDGFACICEPLWTGPDCENPVASACTPNPCVNGTCVLNEQYNKYKCDCDDGFSGDNCEYSKTCTAATCLYGGTCTETNNGGFKCDCLNLYSGNRCEEINRCNYGDPCVNGKCETTVDGITTNYTCTCDDGWTGANCETMIDFCTPDPCKYNSTCTPKFKGYDCTCLTGLTGANCSEIIDLCVPYWDNEAWKWIKSPCNSKDDMANCTKKINGFTCSCGEKWTDTLCDLNVLIKDVLMAIYGHVDLTMITLLNDLMQNPSQIKDMVPFITGLLTDSERSDLSWDAGDLFNWIAFEDQRLDLNRDIHKWNDVVLGNCFTFNHRDRNFTYLMRRPGRHGGIQAFMKTRQDEYAPWYDTAAINVFIHNRDDYVFSESVRYNAQPNAQSTINIFMTRYTRLGGNYGKCIKKPSEVKNYYYPGAYTTDGCLRTCYQDRMKEECNCMDPRYPQAPNSTSCQLSERSCVTEASEAAGDPSTWSSCVCPLPCSNQEYSVTWSKANFVNLPITCEKSSDVATCQKQYKDQLMVSIILPQLDFKIYAETPAMDFNKFLSQLGGQLGVLMGINVVTFIEVKMASFLKKLVKDRSKSPQKRRNHHVPPENGHISRQNYVPPYAPYAPVCYLPLPPSPVPPHQKRSSSRSNESFGIHSWNTEPREIDDTPPFFTQKSTDFQAPPTSPGPLMRTRSHSPRKLKRESNEERKLKSKSKSPQKRATSGTVISQLDYLNSQCHLEGCRADIVVNSTRFMLCRHQLCHASVFFKDLLAGKETNKDYNITVSSMSEPTPSTQFRWFVESCIPCPALKDISDETLETCMRLSQRFQAKGLELRCMKFLIENAHLRQPIVVLCWLNWALKHNFDTQTHAALLPSVSRLSLNALQRHRHMITEHIYSDIITAKLRSTYDKTVQVFLAIHKIDHFSADVDVCPRCKRSKDGMKIKIHCDPCRKQVGCDRCYHDGCEISSRAVEDLQAFFKCPHGMTPINDATDDCQCQIPQMAQYLGNQPPVRYQENNDEYMVPTDRLVENGQKSRKHK